MRKNQRWLALLLAATLILSAIPTTAFASELDVDSAETEIEAETEAETEIEDEVETEDVTETEDVMEVEDATETEDVTEAEDAAETESVTEAAVDDGETEGEGEETTEEDSAEVVALKATQDGVTVQVSGDKDALAGVVSVSVTALSDERIEAYEEALAEDDSITVSEIIAAYDITLLDADGNAVEPQGAVSVTITSEALEEYAEEEIQIIHDTNTTVEAVADESIDSETISVDALEVLEAETENAEEISFTTDSFSTYLVTKQGTDTYDFPSDGQLADGVTYKLQNDVKLETDLTVPSGVTVTIDLNGHTLTGSGSGSVITVEGTLTVTDSGSGAGAITGGFADYSNYTSDEWVSSYSSLSNSGNGGGIYIDGGTVYLESGTISGNTAYNGGGVYVNSGVFIMSGGEISSNLSVRTGGGGGGGVYVYNGSFDMTGGTISNNTAYRQGGAVFINTGVTMTISNGCVISGNKAPNGGGICVNGTLEMSGGTISGNVATEVQEDTASSIDGGGVKINGGTFYFSGGVITDNSAISNSTITAHGGGVYVGIGSMFYVSGDIETKNNQTDDNDDNIYLTSSMVLTLEDDLTGELYVTLASVTGRVVNSDGYSVENGAVSSDNTDVTVEERDNGDIYFVLTNALDENSTGVIASAEFETGTVYYTSLAAAMADIPSKDNVITILVNEVDLDDIVGVPAIGDSIKLTVSDNLLSGTTIKCSDAVAYYFYIAAEAELTVEGEITIEGNSESQTASDTTVSNAFRVRGTLNFGTQGTVSEYPKIENLITAGSVNCGAIYVSGGTLNLYSGTLSENSANRGAAIYASGSTINLAGGKIGSNKCTTCGAIYLSNCTTTIEEVEISSNTATTSGGGIYASQGTLNITDSVIRSNIVGTAGGGIYMTTNVVATIDGSTISSNTAGTTGGGGIYSLKSNLTIKNSTVGGENAGDENSTTNNGGGIFVSGSTLTLETVDVKGNIATNNGGGIYSTSTSTVVISEGSAISSNEANATSGNNGGGGIFVTGSTNLTIKDSEVEKNTAKNYGGGIYVTASSVTMDSSSVISGNTAITSGGGVYITGAATFSGGTISGNGSIAGNTTTNGGGIYITGTSPQISDVTISGNSATNGGGVYIAGTDATPKLSNVTITGNSATSGGGVYSKVATTTLSSVTIGENGAANTATNGGGLYIVSGSVTLESGSIQYNNVTASGGGVYISGGSSATGTFNMSGGSVSNNDAISGAGVYIAVSTNGGTMNLSGGSITENTASDNGGGVYVAGSHASGVATFNMSRGSITANAASSGGGIYLQESKSRVGGVLNLSGGSISGNTDGYGVYIGKNANASTPAAIIVSGSPVVSGNTDGNVYLPAERYITLSGDGLTSGANIGVTVESAAASGTYSDEEIKAENTARQITESENSLYATSYAYFSPDVKTTTSGTYTGYTIISVADTANNYVRFALTTDTYYAITQDFEYVSAIAGGALSVKEEGGYTVTVEANDGYTLPSNITITNSDNNSKSWTGVSGSLTDRDSYSYNASTGVITITGVKANYTISVTADAKELSTTSASITGTYGEAVSLVLGTDTYVTYSDGSTIAEGDYVSFTESGTTLANLGLKLDATTGEIYGTPTATASGTQSVTITVEVANGETATITVSISISENEVTLGLTDENPLTATYDNSTGSVSPETDTFTFTVKDDDGGDLTSTAGTDSYMTVTSSNSTVATATVTDAGEVTVTYSGEQGVAKITVKCNNSNGYTSDDVITKIVAVSREECNATGNITDASGVVVDDHILVVTDASNASAAQLEALVSGEAGGSSTVTSATLNKIKAAFAKVEANNGEIVYLDVNLVSTTSGYENHDTEVSFTLSYPEEVEDDYSSYTFVVLHQELNSSGDTYKDASLLSVSATSDGLKITETTTLSPVAIGYYLTPTASGGSSSSGSSSHKTSSSSSSSGTVTTSVTSTVTSAQTGDTSTPMLWLALIVVAAGAMAGVVYYRRRRKA